MEKIINIWLSVWLYIMVAIGIFLGIKIYKSRKNRDKINTLCTFAIIVLILHVLEEWVFPGGLHYSYNIDHGSSVLSCYPMNRLTDMITNFGGVILGCVVLKFHGFRKPAGVAVMMFSAFEVIIHIVIGITSLKTFGKYGMNTLYSPGLVTSLFGFLPIVTALAKELFFTDKKRPTVKEWIMATVAMFGLCFLLINLPEMLLSDKKSPYTFTDRGYYERFAQEYESNNNIIY